MGETEEVEHGPIGPGVVPPVDVVVLTWNDGVLLTAAVESALASDGVETRVTVVDNGSAPPAAVPEDRRVELVRLEENRGVAAGRNLGVRHGAAPFVCLLDSDARLTPTTLSALVSYLESHDDVALVVPWFHDQSPEASAGRAPSLRVKLARVLGRTSEYVGTRRAGAMAWDVDFGIGACQVFRREVFDAVGGIDERYFYGPEDVDFCLRIREAGWRIVQVAGARCWHPPRRRYRRTLDPRTLRHAGAVARHLWRHRRFRSRVRA